MKIELRKQLQQQRSALSMSEKTEAENHIFHTLSHMPEWQQAQSITSYLPTKGEVSLHALHQAAWQAKKRIFVPIIKPEHLAFVPYLPEADLALNQYQVAEPVYSSEEYADLKNMDLMFLPVVGFDDKGYRLGMGKGYFDRTLAPLIHLAKRPVLIGVAFACQKVAALPVDAWDIPLDKIVTEQGLKTFR